MPYPYSSEPPHCQDCEGNGLRMPEGYLCPLKAQFQYFSLVLKYLIILFLSRIVFSISLTQKSIFFLISVPQNRITFQPFLNKVSFTTLSLAIFDSIFLCQNSVFVLIFCASEFPNLSHGKIRCRKKSATLLYLENVKSGLPNTDLLFLLYRYPLAHKALARISSIIVCLLFIARIFFLSLLLC